MEPERGFLSDEFYTMPGLGALYSRASTYIFGDWNKCGELMGLAPYGRHDQVKHLMEMTDGKLQVPRWNDDFKQPMSSTAATGRKVPRCGTGKIWPGGCRTTPRRCCWPAPAGCARPPAPRTSCMAGGVALNCVANGRVAREAGFDNVWIQPAAGDDGIAIGCAYYGWLKILKQQRNFVMDHSYVGKPYSEQEAASALQKLLVRIQVDARSAATMSAAIPQSCWPTRR